MSVLCIMFHFRLDYESESMKEVIKKLEPLFGAESAIDATSKVPKIIWKILGNKEVILGSSL